MIFGNNKLAWLIYMLHSQLVITLSGIFVWVNLDPYFVLKIICIGITDLVIKPGRTCYCTVWNPGRGIYLQVYIK